ncbi:MAG TPA: hypothetical protein VGN17_13585 [Bryobacteraceae bacterium]|jgi:hypothetical protein
MDPHISALIKLDDTPAQAQALKRLALLFDEIFYLLPDSWPIVTETDRGKPLHEASFVRNLPDGSIDVSQFRFFRDTRYGLLVDVKALNPELRHAIAVFEESGFLKAFDRTKQLGSIALKESRTIENLLAAEDAADEEWNRLSDTSMADYGRNIFDSRLYVTLQLLSKGSSTRELTRQSDITEEDRFTVIALKPPQAVYDSHRLYEVLAYAHRSALYPVFTDSNSRGELAYKYKQFVEGQSKLSERYPSLGRALEFPSRLGEVAYSVSSSVFDSDALNAKTPEEIVKYRLALADARRRYLTGDLVELAQILDCNPWGEETESELRRYITGRLNQDIAKYDGQSQELWEKLFGSMSVRLSEVGKSAILGGTTGGLIGNILPHASTWEIAILGALTGAVREAPRLIQTIVDSIIEARKQKRTSIAYVREFRR